jgi:hypothetical protein
MCNNYLQKRLFHITIVSLCFLTKQLQICNEQMFVARCMSQPHFEASVRMRFTPPKVGTWSPPGLLHL